MAATVDRDVAPTFAAIGAPRPPASATCFPAPVVADFTDWASPTRLHSGASTSCAQAFSSLAILAPGGILAGAEFGRRRRQRQARRRRDVVRLASEKAQAGSGTQSRVPPTAPAPWRVFEVEDKPGTYYYYNEETGQSEWDLPTESESKSATPRMEAQPSEMGAESTSDGTDAVGAGAGSSSEGARLHPCPPWQMIEDEDNPGDWYYYNSETKETAWELPEGTPMLPPFWTAVEDDQEPGRFYFYNEVTEESQWEQPLTYEVLPVEERKRPSSESGLRRLEPKAFGYIQAACQSQGVIKTPEDLEKYLKWFQEELHPYKGAWQEAAEKDARLFQPSLDVLKESLAWLEEFLWNQDWATGFGRQRLSDAIRHCPRLLYQGVDSMEDTVAWLAEKGLTDAAVREYVADATAVPFPLEPYPWLEMLQLGRGKLEKGFAWMTSELAMPEEKARQILLREPRALLAAATAAGASEPPYPEYPVPVPKEDWASTQAEKYGVFVHIDLPDPVLSA